MAQVKTIGEAVRNMSVLMANMYYHLTIAVIEIWTSFTISPSRKVGICIAAMRMI